MSFNDIGVSFVRQYYEFFSKNRDQLAGVYRPNSLMTWVGEQLQGGGNIMARFANLGFNEAFFKTEDIDCHPSLSNGILVVVNGEVLLKDERHPLKFNDVFHLAQDGNQWYISNQIFRIIGGGGQ